MEDLNRLDPVVEVVLEAAANGILVVDDSGKAVKCNSRFLEIFDLPQEAVLWSDPEALNKHLSSRTRHPVKVQSFSGREGMVGRSTSEIELKDGRIIEVHGNPYVSEGGMKGVVISFIEKNSGQMELLRKSIIDKNGEISDLEKMNIELEEEVNESSIRLRDAEREAMIGEIATMVGHDLRNPLQVVINRIYIAKISAHSHQNSAVELESLIKTLEKQVDYMNKIVSNLLDCGRELRPDICMVEFKSLVYNALSSVPGVEKYSVSVLSKEGLRFPVDVELMSRVLVNLTNNAMQAMPEGGSIEYSAEASGSKYLIRVRDSGPGICPDNLRRIFTPFFTTKSKGMGLGLLVAKRIVEAHGGNISVESRPGEGATFCIELPCPGSA